MDSFIINACNMTPQEVANLTSEEYSRCAAIAEFIINVIRSEHHQIFNGRGLDAYRSTYYLDLTTLLDPQLALTQMQQPNRKESLRQKHMNIIQDDLKDQSINLFGLIDD